MTLKNFDFSLKVELIGKDSLAKSTIDKKENGYLNLESFVFFLRLSLRSRACCSNSQPAISWFVKEAIIVGSCVAGRNSNSN